MKLINKNEGLDLLITICIFLFLICFPIDLLTKNIYLIYIFQIIFRVLFIFYVLIFVVYINKKFSINLSFQKSDTLFIPFLIIVFNNLIFLLFKQKDTAFTYNFEFILQIILTIFVSISEELLFRCYFHKTFNIKNKLTKIIVSSLFFALFHVVYFLSSFNPLDLIRIVYTFGLGLVLGFIYEFSNHNFLYICLLHFLFNFLNNDLFINLYNGTNDYVFYIVSIIISIVTSIYGISIYFLYFKKSAINQ